MKLRKSALLALVLAAALLAACTGKTPDDTPDGGGEQETVELTFWTFPVGEWGNPTAVSAILTGFHRAHPEIHITVDYLDYNSGDAQIEQARADGKSPDLVMEGPERLVANWGEKGWMADLSDLWESEASGEIYEIVREACRHGRGAYYEYPVCMSAHCMAINYEMFREAGALQYIDEEKRTWTTEGFMQAVQALAEHGQETVGVVYCRNQSGDQGTRALVRNLYGGSFADSAHQSYTVDSPEMRRALQLLYDLEGIVFDPDMTSDGAIEQFCRQEAAMCFCWNASLELRQTINNPYMGFDILPVAFPTDQDAPRLEGGIWGLGVFDNGSPERIEAAKTFIRYLTENDAVYTRAVQASSYWPVRNIEVYENDRLMTEYSMFTPYMGDYYQTTPGWAGARTAWWKLLARVGAGEDVASAVHNFPN